MHFLVENFFTFWISGFYFPVFSLSKFSCLEMYMKKKKQFVFGETFTKDFSYFGFLTYYFWNFFISNFWSPYDL